jgi:hypothetical protein
LPQTLIANASKLVKYGEIFGSDRGVIFVSCCDSTHGISGCSPVEPVVRGSWVRVNEHLLVGHDPITKPGEKKLIIVYR